MAPGAAALPHAERPCRVTPPGPTLARLVFGDELVRAPATVMAGGIFLLFAGPFLLTAITSAAAAEQIVRVGTWLLAALYGFIAVLFVLELRARSHVVWDYTIDHFAIGTWVAGTNVLARVIHAAAPLISQALAVVGWTLAGVYLFWVAKMIRRPGVAEGVNGVAFLTTVAVQSLVVTSVRLPVHPSTPLLSGLLLLNILGVLMYAYWFAVLCRGGIARHLGAWAPVNNITHGALSISLLAAELLADHLPALHAVLLPVIQALWVATAMLFGAVFLVETGLILRGCDLFAFRVANYARNFTYGMFFACSYYGASRFPRSIMATVMSRPLLLLLASMVAALNLWEFGRHAVRVARAAVPHLEASRG